MTETTLNKRVRKLELVSKLFYKEFDKDHWEKRVAACVSPEMRVLEIGAGSGEGFQYKVPLNGSCKYSLGIDLDPRVLDNPNFDDTAVASAYDLSIAKHGEFDLIISNFVGTHR